MRIEGREGLLKGTAYGTAPTISSTAADWPVYRNNNSRSGRTPTPVSGKLARGWETKLPSRPTAPTIVGNLVYVAARDSHVLYALSRQTGRTVWTFTTGGRIDSPPAFHRGLLLLGCRNGWVYALRADNGELAWQFCDLPSRRLMAADGQLESAWPISGAVMIRDGVRVVDCRENALRGCTIRNVAVACGNSNGLPDLKTYQIDPGFVDRDAMDLGLRDDAAVHADVEGFEEIPFAKIGLYADEFRTTLPGYRREIADWTPGQDASRYGVLDRD